MFSAWVHHILNDPLSVKETCKVELLVFAVAAVVFAAWWGFIGRKQ